MGNYSVYRHISPNGKMYVGITGRPPKSRWANGSAYKNNSHFSSAIEEYGWDNFTHEILLDNLTQKQAECAEIIFIGYWDLTNREKGYNIQSGGGWCGFKSYEARKKTSQSLKGRKFSAEHRHKLSLAKKGKYVGEKSPSFGIPKSDETKMKISKALTGNKLSEETKRKLSESHSGENNHFFGKKHSEESLRKMSEANKGKIISDETKMKISQSLKGESHYRATKVSMVDKTTGEVVKTFDTISKASEYVGAINGTHICDVCKGKRKSAYGYMWEYKSE